MNRLAQEITERPAGMSTGLESDYFAILTAGQLDGTLLECIRVRLEAVREQLGGVYEREVN